MNILLLFLVAIPLAEETDRKASATTAATPRRFKEINDDIKAFLKREATAETDADRMAAIRDICALFVEIKRDPRLQDQPALLGYKAKVWTRLNRIKKELKRHVTQESKNRDQANEFDLSQQEYHQEISRYLSEQMLMVNQGSGGPANMVNYASGSWGGGAIEDNAQKLIDLIQTAIAPETWDINGGNGSIFFYAPVNALVVRATSETHFQIGGAFDALRRAGR